MNIVDYLKGNQHFRHALLDSNMIDILPCGLSISTDISCETIIHNKIAAKFYGIKPYEVFSHSAKEPPQVKVYQNGKLLSVEEMPIQQAAWYGIETYSCTLEFVWDKGISKTALISAVPLRDNNEVIIGCISTLEDISSFVNLNHELDEKNQLLREEIHKVRAAEESLAFCDEKYHSLFNSMNESFCIIEMLFDSEEKPINWRYLETNPAFRENASLKNVEGKFIRDLIPDHEESWFEIYGKVALTGEPIKFVHWTKALNRWYELSVYKVGGSNSRKVAVLFNNVTESKQTEDKLRFQADLLYSVNEAIIAVNENGNISYWNKVAEDIFGWSASEIFGADIIQLIHKSVLNPHQKIITEITQKGLYNGEIIFKRKDGTIIVIDIRCKAINNRQSEFNRIVVSARDITKQKQLEEKLSNLSENLYAELNILKRLHQISAKLIQYHNNSQKLFDEILDAAIELTNASKGNLLIFNEEKGYLENVAQSGFSKDLLQQFEAISQGRGPHGRVFRNKARLIVEDVSKSIIFNETKDLDVILNRNIHSMQATPLISSAGIFIGMLSTYYKNPHEFNDGELLTLDLLARQAADAVERNKYREELDKNKKHAFNLVEKLQKMDTNKTKFFNTLSHELRNPMASIMMSLSFLESISFGREQSPKALQIAKRQGEQLTRLVDDLLDMTRISQNKVKLKKVCVELNNIIKQSVEDYMGEFINKEVGLTAEFAYASIYIDADPARMTQVFGNLLHNACKFTDKGDNVLVNVNYDQETIEAVITLKDTGRGIEPEVQHSLFEPFMQADDTLDRSQGGLGLGLAIVQGMIKLHGGSITVLSEGLGKGTQFTIRIPAILDRIEECKEKTSVGSNHSFKILVIDDIPDIAEILYTLLNHLGYEAITASNGLEGIRKAKEFKPKVILCDIGLPGMNGYDVAKSIRNDRDLRDVYLIALSGYAQTEDLERSIAAGFNKHLAKPVDLDTLKTLLAEVI